MPRGRPGAEAGRQRRPLDGGHGKGVSIVKSSKLIIGVEKGKTATMTDSNRHTIFVPLKSTKTGEFSKPNFDSTGTDAQTAIVDSKIWSVRFSVGSEGKVDLREFIESDRRPIVRQLRDPAVFANLRVDADTVVWANGFDLPPSSCAPD
jgi:hypothetical protein